jgi:hypothetical protein
MWDVLGGFCNYAGPKDRFEGKWPGQLGKIGDFWKNGAHAKQNRESVRFP